MCRKRSGVAWWLEAPGLAALWHGHLPGLSELSAVIARAQHSLPFRGVPGLHLVPQRHLLCKAHAQ